MGDATRHVPCPLRAAALAAPDAPALVGARGTTSYEDLDGQVSAAALRLGGLEPGSRVALLLPKDERYVALVLALIRAGHVACPISDQLPPQGVAPLLEKAACSVMVSDDGDLPRTVGAGIRGLGPEDLLGESRQRAEAADIPLERPSTIVFTSGSTGVPKAALHTFGNHYRNAEGSNANILLRPGDRWLHSLPLYHVGGLSILFRCLLAGATVALPRQGIPIGEAIDGLGATHVSLVSTQLLRLLRENTDPRGLRAVLMGGGPIPASLVDEAVLRGLPIHTSYGLTEMSSQVTTTPTGASREELHTSGRVLPGREVSISGDGEILVRGGTLFAGYVDGENVDRPLDREGWFHTGDLGELDEDGYLRVGGRKDNLFISGGENVQPEEIEEALSGLSKVEAAVVVPVPDHEFGHRPVAFVKMEDGGPEGLAPDLGKILPRFKVPIAFHPWPEEARWGMKVDRTALAELARRLYDQGEAGAEKAESEAEGRSVADKRGR
ncbi:O-succinylbenzoic acid--CoA ligase [uncultured Rubrobacteraceae bacterium]|uniref:O-succinylbenzoic acid--CoA ligase n=1 Tax=uncultured Rubrobacteraceae bacterium TaxID=349277 RepID=A0A6J4Q1J8_9ACTN|nr:O-succinylbenzoic acid--CoA ligase [uncultured Rubrobacteraceae bacterium]